MESLRIDGGECLTGEVTISGAKNAALPILFASLLSQGAIDLSNVPHLQDVTIAIALLGRLGAKVMLDDSMRVHIDNRELNAIQVDARLARSMRASVLVLGPLLARFGEAKVPLPGGCTIGTRPVNWHIDAMRAFGASVDVHNGYIHAVAPKGLIAAEFYFDGVSVTGTENVMMAAVMAKGRTVIHHAACEPEVVDLANFLNAMGAQVTGAGTPTITIEGVGVLNRKVSYTIMPDRIEAGTFLVAVALTRGQVRLTHVRPELLEAVLAKLMAAGAEIKQGTDWIELKMRRRPKAVHISTSPYPGFPTDMQAQFMALNTIAEGNSVITETIFENRFMHAQELARMGAKVSVQGNVAYCEGSSILTGAEVLATDLRASASLVLAALVAEGQTYVRHVHHIDRGYERIEEKLLRLGAKIKRVSDVTVGSEEVF